MLLLVQLLEFYSTICTPFVPRICIVIFDVFWDLWSTVCLPKLIIFLFSHYLLVLPTCFRFLAGNLPNFLTLLLLRIADSHPQPMFKPSNSLTSKMLLYLISSTILYDAIPLPMYRPQYPPPSHSI